jgi:hypothetical protein
MLVNLAYAAIPALIAYGAGLDPWWSALVGWAMYRIEFWYDAVGAIARAQVAQANIAGHVAERGTDLP